MKTVVVVGALLLAGCGGVESSYDPAASRSKVTSTSEAPAASSPAGPPPSATFTVVEVTDGSQVQAGFDITDRYGIGVRASAAQDTIELLRHLETAYPQATQFLITGYYPMKDEYGNTDNKVVLNAAYDRSTVEKINFDGIDRSGIWDIRDGGGGMFPNFG